MKTYLVGGAVRDTLLGVTPKDRDYVVVGASVDDMISNNFTQVGAGFPVFLKDGEEYALARTEVKTGRGYNGFDTRFEPTTTLEEDLLRRDLTINAIAYDMDTDTYIDPFNGRSDLESRVLRHTSSAFIEDPLRVLRVARFRARYASRGFTIAPETLQLMSDITSSGELSHLVPERVWKEMVEAMSGPSPSVFFQTLHDCGALKIVLPEVDDLFGVPQHALHHPEIDTGIHTMMVVDVARQLSDDPALIFAALVHDLGKALTPSSEWPAHHAHEERGVPVVEAVCDRLKTPARFRRLGVMVCREHLNVHRIRELRAATLHDLIYRCGGHQRPTDIRDLALVCEADKRGRLGMTESSYSQGDMLVAAMEAMNAVKFTNLPTHTKYGEPILRDGERIARDLRMVRIGRIKAATNNVPEDQSGRTK